jgi:hypothetical protein
MSKIINLFLVKIQYIARGEKGRQKKLGEDNLND